MKNLGEKLAESWLSKSLLDLSTLSNKEIPSSRKEAFEAQNIFYKLINKKTVGWKIGAVAKEVQKEEGYDGPVPGKIFQETFLETNTEINFNDIPYSNLECEYALQFPKDARIDNGLEKGLSQVKLFTAIDITSTRYEQTSKAKHSKLVQMYLGIADHGNGGRIIIGHEIVDWQKKDINKVKIKFDINGNKSEPYFTGSKRIHPLISLKAFIDEFKDQNMQIKAYDYLLCGSLIQPYSIKKNDYIKIEYEELSKFEIKIK
jgi:2-keto-4-pentenoate hydratase